MGSLRRPDVRRRALVRAAKACGVVGVLLVLAALPLTTGHHIEVVRPASNGGGPGSGGGTTVQVNVTASDAPAFAPNSVTVPEGSLVELSIVNTGAYSHTFTISKVPNHQISGNVTPSELDAFFNANGSLLNLTLNPHSTTDANISLASTDGGNSYEFVSVVPYQFQAGMFGFLNVSTGPSGPPVVLNESALQTQTLWDPSILAVNTSSYPVALNIRLTNMGSLAHTWWLSPLPGFNLSPANFTTFFQQHSPLAAVNLPGSAGGIALANFTVAQAGVYEYICTIPGHFANGMFGFLYVGVAPPAPPTSPSTALVQEGVLVGGAALLGIGVLLALIASFTGRFPRRPDAEPTYH